MAKEGYSPIQLSPRQKTVKDIQALQGLLGMEVQDYSDYIEAALKDYLPSLKDRLELEYRKG